MCDDMFYIDMGEMPADSWWKLITPKEIIAGMNQLKGRNILILYLVSSDMVLSVPTNHVLILPLSGEFLVRLPI